MCPWRWSTMEKSLPWRRCKRSTRATSWAFLWAAAKVLEPWAAPGRAVERTTSSQKGWWDSCINCVHMSYVICDWNKLHTGDLSDLIILHPRSWMILLNFNLWRKNFCERLVKLATCLSWYQGYANADGNLMGWISELCYCRIDLNPKAPTDPWSKGAHRGLSHMCPGYTFQYFRSEILNSQL